MNLVVDVGNTCTKYAFFKHGELLSSGTDSNNLFRELEEKSTPVNIFFSGSGKTEGILYQQLKKKASGWLEASPSLSLPIKIGYETPETLGFDRIACCAGAHHLFPNTALLVIDAGTAITFDYIDRSGTFLGGNISPGYHMRFQALHSFTERLPLLNPVHNYTLCGKNTQQAITNGVMNGILFEMNEYIKKFFQKEGNGNVLLTGGDSLFLKGGTRVNYIKNLSLLGLNVIMEYNKI